MKRPEILSPAGNYEKMRAAILYGADAVYLAGESFGMRAAADNFTVDEMREAVEYAHVRGVRVYLTLNTMPREYEYALLEKYLSDISDIPLDAMIIADVGVLALVKRMLPNMEIHMKSLLYRWIKIRHLLSLTVFPVLQILSRDGTTEETMRFCTRL